MNKIISVAEKYPESIKYWDYEKNNCLPNNVSFGICKKYYWKCKNGHSSFTIPKDKARSDFSCPVCSGRKLLRGYNDLWTTHPEIAKMLANEEDGYCVTYGSRKKLDWICPLCGSLAKSKEVNMIRTRGEIPCKCCGDGVSYPEKVFISLFNFLGLNYIHQLSRTYNDFKWCNDYRYDFYIEEYSLIIEVHGGFHYTNEFKHKNAKTLEETIINDELKKTLAINNSIKNYVVVDCKLSHFNYIMNNILNSELAKIIDLTNVDWDYVKNNIVGSYVVDVCQYFNQNPSMTLKDIAKHFSKDKGTITQYLKNGTKIGLCNYDMSTHKKEACKHYHYKKPVRCVTTNEVFESARFAGKQYNINSANITTCCKGNAKHAGKLDNGIRLEWEYV